MDAGLDPASFSYYDKQNGDGNSISHYHHSRTFLGTNPLL